MLESLLLQPQLPFLNISRPLQLSRDLRVLMVVMGVMVLMMLLVLP
jgi:hypothetical protein